MKRRTLYLYCGVKGTDLFGKALLAARAAARGWRVYLGGFVEILDMVAHRCAPGLLVENNVFDSKAERLGGLKARGFRIADLDEEGIIYLDPERYCTEKIGPRALEATDLVLATGARQEGHIRAHRPRAADKLRLTGNPRFDTLMPRVRTVFEESAGAIRERHGRFLLVNLNFNPANPGRKTDMVAKWRKLGKLATPRQIDLVRRWVDYKKRQMRGLQTLLAEVARAGAFERIVLRPHPEEDHDTWRAWAADVGGGVEFRYDPESGANPWMLAAAMMLHAGCTTGIEALLLDLPSVSFAPEPDSEFQNPADAVSVRVATAGEFLAQAASWETAGDRARAIVGHGRSVLRPYVENVAPPLAADRILDAADGLDVPETGTARYAIGRACRTLVETSTAGGRRARRRVRDKSSGAFRIQRFPGLAVEDVRAPIARWVEAGVLDRMPAITRVERAVLRLH